MTSNGSLEALSSDQSLDVNNNEQSVINSSHVEFCSDVVDEIDFSSKDTQRFFTRHMIETPSFSIFPQ